MSALRCVEVVLTIPDNEARTALATLRRLGIEAAGLERADLYRCEVESEAAADELVETLRGLEPVFNPNKHALRLRAAAPQPGELWVEEAEAADAPQATAPVRIAGRALPGVLRLTRAVAWRLLDGAGAAAERSIVERASELLCNPAFQKATTA